MHMQITTSRQTIAACGPNNVSQLRPQVCNSFHRHASSCWWHVAGCRWQVQRQQQQQPVNCHRQQQHQWQHQQQIAPTRTQSGNAAAGCNSAAAAAVLVATIICPSTTWPASLLYLHLPKRVPRLRPTHICSNAEAY